MDYDKPWRCPRCGRMVIGFPALSRLDNKTDICSACGTEEALLDWKGHLMPKKTVVKPHIRKTSRGRTVVRKHTRKTTNKGRLDTHSYAESTEHKLKIRDIGDQEGLSAIQRDQLVMLIERRFPKQRDYGYIREWARRIRDGSVYSLGDSQTRKVWLEVLDEA